MIYTTSKQNANIKAVIYDGAGITSAVNASNPKLGDPCHCLHTDSRNYLLILNDQGGNAMNVSENITATLRAQEHGHPPVVCFEPGIVKREGGESRFVTDKSVTLRANMGDNQPAICFQQNQREEVRNMGKQTGALTAESGMHNTNYIVYPTLNTHTVYD